TVVNIGAQGLERNLTLPVLFATGHFRAAQTTRHLTADTAHAQLDRAGNRLPHRALIADALLDLLRDRFGDELRIGFQMPNLLDIDVNGLLRQLLQVGLEQIHARTATPDDDARLCRVQRHLDLIGLPLDLHFRDSGIIPTAALLDDLADFMILQNE